MCVVWVGVVGVVGVGRGLLMRGWEGWGGRWVGEVTVDVEIEQDHVDGVVRM